MGARTLVGCKILGKCPALRHAARPACLGPDLLLLRSAMACLVMRKSICEFPVGCSYVGCLRLQLLRTTSRCLASISRRCPRSCTASRDWDPCMTPLPATAARGSRLVFNHQKRSKRYSRNSSVQSLPDLPPLREELRRFLSCPIGHGMLINSQNLPALLPDLRSHPEKPPWDNFLPANFRMGKQVLSQRHHDSILLLSLGGRVHYLPPARAPLSRCCPVRLLDDCNCNITACLQVMQQLSVHLCRHATSIPTEHSSPANIRKRGSLARHANTLATRINNSPFIDSTSVLFCSSHRSFVGPFAHLRALSHPTAFPLVCQNGFRRYGGDPVIPHANVCIQRLLSTTFQTSPDLGPGRAKIC